MNYQINYTRRSSLSDGYYVSAKDDRMTIKQFVGGLAFAVTLVLAYITLALWF